MPLITTLANASARGYGGLRAAAGAANSYESIATVTVGSGGSSTITFSSIPSTYTHLQLRILAQTNRGTYGIDDLLMTFNSSTSSYAYHFLFGDGGSSAADAYSSQSNLRLGAGSVGTTTGSNWGAMVVDILDYRSTNKNKTVRILGGADCNGTVGGLGGRVGLSSGLWYATPAAVSSLTLTPSTGTSISQYSHFALYGIKGS